MQGLFVRFRRLKFETLDSRQLLTANGIDVSLSESFYLEADQHHDSALLTNESTVPARFTMRFNGNISVNTQDLVQQIREFEVPGQPSMPDYEKAYHYMLEYHAHDYPISPKTWLHDPTLYLNSIGAGFCDDSASALKLIWNAMGYESRVWLLDGHVVSEVHTGERWQMYDADLRLVYYNDAGQPAGVEELAANPHYIYSPKVRFDAANGTGVSHSKRTASFYWTTENNRICTSCTPETDVANLIFEIPAGGTLRVGEISPERSLPNALTESTSLGLATVTIPPGSTGTLDIPLALFDVTGSPADTVGIGGQQVSLETDEAFELFNTDNDQARSQVISFENTVDSIQVHYLLNSKLTELHQQNEIQIGHVGEPNDLRVELESPLARRWVFTPASDGTATALRRHHVVGSHFDGTSYFEVDDAEMRQVLHAERDFEIQAKLKIDHSDGTRRPVVDSFRFSFEIDAQNRPYAYYKASSGRWIGLRGEAIADGEWTDLSLSYVDGDLTLSVNGQHQGTAYGPGLDRGYLVQDLKIGGSDHTGGLRFQGELSEVSFRSITNHEFVWDVDYVDEVFGEAPVGTLAVDAQSRLALELASSADVVERIAGDITNDGRVQFDDFVIFSDNFGKVGDNLSGDFDSDGEVSFADFLAISRNYGT